MEDYFLIYFFISFKSHSCGFQSYYDDMRVGIISMLQGPFKFVQFFPDT